MTTSRPSNPAAPPVGAGEGESQPQDTSTIDTGENTATDVARVMGFVGGVIGIIANDCAGGARGMVKAAGLEEKPSEMLFQVGVAANLLVAGGVAYGTSAALGVLAAGERAWNEQAAEVRTEVNNTVDEYVDTVLSAPSKENPPSPAQIVARAAVGELVGMAGGAVVGARSGFKTGAALGQRAAHYAAEKYHALTA